MELLVLLILYLVLGLIAGLINDILFGGGDAYPADAQARDAENDDDDAPQWYRDRRGGY